MLKSRRSRQWVPFLTFLLIPVLSNVAVAQRGNRGGQRLGNASAMHLLILETVQQELKLSDEQKRKTESIHEKLLQQRRNIFSEVTRESGQRGPKLAEIDKRANADVAKMLDEAQRKRLKELLLQVNGVTELLKDEFAETLAITDEQKKQLVEVSRANSKARRTAREELDGSSAITRDPRMAELHREAAKKLLAVLTEEQRQKFETMQGKKIRIDLKE